MKKFLILALLAMTPFTVSAEAGPLTDTGKFNEHKFERNYKDFQYDNGAHVQFARDGRSQAIRSEEFKATQYDTYGQNSRIYRMLETDWNRDLNLPGIVPGQSCIHYRTCQRRAFNATSGYGRYYVDYRPEGEYGKRFFSRGYNRPAAGKLDLELTGKSKLQRFRAFFR